MTLRQKLACVGLTVFGLQIASAAAGGAPAPASALNRRPRQARCAFSRSATRNASSRLCEPFRRGSQALV